MIWCLEACDDPSRKQNFHFPALPSLVYITYLFAHSSFSPFQNVQIGVDSTGTVRLEEELVATVEQCQSFKQKDDDSEFDAAEWICDSRGEGGEGCQVVW